MHIGEQTGYFKSFDRTDIFYSVLKNSADRGIILLAHGVGEHSGRYRRLKDALVELGVNVYALDHRGHGKSGGQRGHVSHFTDYIADLRSLHEMAIAESPGRPVILFGHSMGGIIAAEYALQYQDDLYALILSSPGLRFSIEIPPWKRVLANILSVIVPIASFNNGISADQLSHDPVEVKRYQEDPLNHDRISARWAAEFQRSGRYCLEQAEAIHLPLLVLQGDADQIVDKTGSEDFYNKCRSDQKEMLKMPGLFHECLNETLAERERVLTAIQAWVDTTLPSQAICEV